VIREEGINGDREMIASLYLVGFDVIDIMVTDIQKGYLGSNYSHFYLTTNQFITKCRFFQSNN